MGLFLGFLSCSIGLYFCFCANTTLSWSMVAAMEQKCGQEELPHVQGKRNPSKTVGTEGIRGQTNWNHKHRQLANLITQTTALSNSMRLSHAMCGHPRWMGHGSEVWQNVVHWRREWQTTSVFLPWEPHEQYEKAKRYKTERWTPQVGRCPRCYWRSL